MAVFTIEILFPSAHFDNPAIRTVCGSRNCGRTPGRPLPEAAPGYLPQ